MTDNKNLNERFDTLEKRLDNVAPANSHSNSPCANSKSDEIDLGELCYVIWQGKWIIIAITLTFAVASVIYALSLPNIYRSEVLLAPVEENSGGGLSALAGQFGGLASLAGVNLGEGGGDKTVLAIEVLKSRDFVTHFISKHDLLVSLMAAKGWNQDKDELVIDSQIYNTKEGVWTRDVSEPKKPKPSMLEAYEAFRDRLGVSQDKQTNFVSISFDFFSPSISKYWVDQLVEDINLELKTRDVSEAKRSIEYLTDQLQKTSIADMQSIFYELIEEQTKTVMFAEVRDEYVFKTIDPAVEPELKIGPKRLSIVIIGLVCGSVLSLIVVFGLCFVTRFQSGARERAQT